MRDVIYHTPPHVKKSEIGGSQIFQKSSFLISLSSPPIFQKWHKREGKRPHNFFANAIGFGTEKTPRHISDPTLDWYLLGFLNSCAMLVTGDDRKKF